MCNSGRIEREKKTIEAMAGIYCRAHHCGRAAAQPGPQSALPSPPPSARGLCEDCAALLRYALARLDHCVYGGAKPACSKCPVHCYKPEMRQRVREVMRFAGPRMILYHPILAILHWLDALAGQPSEKFPKK